MKKVIFSATVTFALFWIVFFTGIFGFLPVLKVLDFKTIWQQYDWAVLTAGAFFLIILYLAWKGHKRKDYKTANKVSWYTFYGILGSLIVLAIIPIWKDGEEQKKFNEMSARTVSDDSTTTTKNQVSPATTPAALTQPVPDDVDPSDAAYQKQQKEMWEQKFDSAKNAAIEANQTLKDLTKDDSLSRVRKKEICAIKTDYDSVMAVLNKLKQQIVKFSSPQSTVCDCPDPNTKSGKGRKNKNNNLVVKNFTPKEGNGNY